MTKSFLRHLLLVTMAANFCQAQEFDLVVRNGRIIDGSGNPWFHGDVAIKKNKIVKVGRFQGRGKREIDAAGRLVTPGFIDMHSHSDLSLLRDGNAQGKVRQGVTTEILGESGSPAPRCPKPDAKPSTDPNELKLDWTDFKGYFQRLKKDKISVNVASFVGMGGVRACAMGEDNRPPTAEELEKMRRYVDEAMRQGAMGLSAGLIYVPNNFSKTEEIIELAKVASRHGGIYSVHMRNEGLGILAAIQETVRIGQEAKLPVHIMHFKVSGKRSWGTIGAAIAAVNEARAKGVEVHADQYPYIASATSLSVTLPNWAQEGGTQKMLARLRDPADRERMREEMNKAMASGGRDWKAAVIGRVRTEKNKPWEGKSIADVALARNKTEFDTVADLLIEEGGNVGMVYFGIHEDDVKLAMQQPWVSVGSDGSALNTDPASPLSSGKPHPRSYGTFPRVLARYVREAPVISLENAIRKMTSLAAQQMGIQDRGLLRKEMKADVLIFDENKVIDNATFENPHQYAEGIDFVIVNGKVVIDQGNHTNERPGVVIKGRGAE